MQVGLADDDPRKHFGFDRFDLVAHDRGARVAHRLVLDHPGIVDNLMVLDITPTLDMYEKTNMTFVRVLPTLLRVADGDGVADARRRDTGTGSS